MEDKFKTMDEYLQTVPPDVRDILEKIRQTIRKAAPGAVESISYQMPAFKLNGKILVYFAAWKNHIGFYALPSGNAAFEKELSAYKMAKGSIQFPLDKPIPFDLIEKMVKFRAAENLNKKKTPAKNSSGYK